MAETKQVTKQWYYWSQRFCWASVSLGCLGMAQTNGCWSMTLFKVLHSSDSSALESECTTRTCPGLGFSVLFVMLLYYAFIWLHHLQWPTGRCHKMPAEWRCAATSMFIETQTYRLNISFLYELQTWFRKTLQLILSLRPLNWPYLRDCWYPDLPFRCCVKKICRNSPTNDTKQGFCTNNRRSLILSYTLEE